MFFTCYTFSSFYFFKLLKFHLSKRIQLYIDKEGGGVKGEWGEVGRFALFFYFYIFCLGEL